MERTSIRTVTGKKTRAIGTGPYPDYPRRRTKAKQRWGKANNKVRPSQPDTVPVVTGTLKPKMYFYDMKEYEVERILSLAKQVLPIISEHPCYVDRGWDLDTKPKVVLEHILSNLRNTCPEETDLILGKERGSLKAYWFKPYSGCNEQANLIEWDFLPVIAKSNRRFYKLCLHFLSFCEDYLKIPMWGDHIEECIIEYLLDEIDWLKQEKEPDYHAIKYIRKDLDYFLRYSIGHYLNRFSAIKCGPEQLSRLLKCYRPIKKHYKAMRDWMLEGIEIHSQGFDYDISSYGRVTPEDYYDNGEARPYEYCRFVWSIEDSIGNHITESLDDKAGNCGIIPMFDILPVEKGCIEKATRQFGLTQRFYDWMYSAHDIIYNLINRESA